MAENITDFNIREKKVEWWGPNIPEEILDTRIKAGIVAGEYVDSDFGTIIYNVIFKDAGGSNSVPCHSLSASSSVLNQQYSRLISTRRVDKNAIQGWDSLKYAAGDIVVVAFLNGLSLTKGVILGSLSHPIGQQPWMADPTIMQFSSVVGLEQVINDKGEYSITFNGRPKNITEMVSINEGKAILPVKETERGGTKLAFMVDGSFEVNDNGSKGKSWIKINKPDGHIHITSYKTTEVTVDGANKKIDIRGKTLSFDTVTGQKAGGKITAKAETASIDASKSFSVKSPKIAIGTAESELLDLITQLIDALSGIMVITPMGPAQAFKQDVAGTWASKVEDIKGKIKGITGKIE